MTLHFPPPAALAMSHVFTLAMVDAMPPRAPGPLGLAPAGIGARLTLADQHRISAAMAEVMAARTGQLERGHAFAKDLVQDDRFLLRSAGRYLNHAIEDRQFDYPRAVAIRHAAQSAALLLAFIEVQTERMAQEAADQPEEIAA